MSLDTGASFPVPVFDTGPIVVVLKGRPVRASGLVAPVLAAVSVVVVSVVVAVLVVAAVLRIRRPVVAWFEVWFEEEDFLPLGWGEGVVHAGSFIFSDITDLIG